MFSLLSTASSLRSQLRRDPKRGVSDDVVQVLLERALVIDERLGITGNINKQDVMLKISAVVAAREDECCGEHDVL